MGELLIRTLASLGVLVGIAIFYQFMERRQERGRTIRPHLIWWGMCAAVVTLLPKSIATYIFDSLTMTMVATVFPVYESLRAICTPDEDDDKKWLQYWIAGGVIFMGTSWVDKVISPDNVIYWYEIMTFFFTWLFLPKLNGCALIYDHFTEPYLAPKVKPLAAKMNNWIAYIYQTAVNAAHLWVVWIVFMFLPATLKRTIAIALGTVYPAVSSILAVMTEEIADDTYWLTYWSCYGCLFLIMDVLEQFIGWIPGFYTLVIFSTIYLMLPMFQGSDKVFRTILVPLAGLKEMLMLRDAIQIKKAILKDLDPERAKIVRKAIANIYNDDDSNNTDTLKEELMSEYKSMTGSFRSMLRGKNETTEPKETTSLV
jgi:hypothetical protein